MQFAALPSTQGQPPIIPHSPRPLYVVYCVKTCSPLFHPIEGKGKTSRDEAFSAAWGSLLGEPGSRFAYGVEGFVDAPTIYHDFLDAVEAPVVFYPVL